MSTLEALRTEIERIPTLRAFELWDEPGWVHVSITEVSDVHDRDVHDGFFTFMVRQVLAGHLAAGVQLHVTAGPVFQAADGRRKAIADMDDVELDDLMVLLDHRLVEGVVHNSITITGVATASGWFEFRAGEHTMVVAAVRGDTGRQIAAAATVALEANKIDASYLTTTIGGTFVQWPGAGLAGEVVTHPSGVAATTSTTGPAVEAARWSKLLFVERARRLRHSQSITTSGSRVG